MNHKGHADPTPRRIGSKLHQPLPHPSHGLIHPSTSKLALPPSAVDRSGPLSSHRQASKLLFLVVPGFGADLTFRDGLEPPAVGARLLFLSSSVHAATALLLGPCLRRLNSSSTDLPPPAASGLLGGRSTAAHGRGCPSVWLGTEATSREARRRSSHSLSWHQCAAPLSLSSTTARLLLHLLSHGRASSSLLSSVGSSPPPPSARLHHWLVAEAASCEASIVWVPLCHWLAPRGRLPRGQAPLLMLTLGSNASPLSHPPATARRLLHLLLCGRASSSLLSSAGSPPPPPSPRLRR